MHTADGIDIKGSIRTDGADACSVQQVHRNTLLAVGIDSGDSNIGAVSGKLGKGELQCAARAHELAVEIDTVADRS